MPFVKCQVRFIQGHNVKYYTAVFYSDRRIFGQFFILVEDVKLIMEKILEVSRRNLPPFFHFPGGAESAPPPPSGVWANATAPEILDGKVAL